MAHPDWAKGGWRVLDRVMRSGPARCAQGPRQLAVHRYHRAATASQSTRALHGGRWSRPSIVSQGQGLSLTPRRMAAPQSRIPLRDKQSGAVDEQFDGIRKCGGQPRAPAATASIRTPEVTCSRGVVGQAARGRGRSPRCRTIGQTAGSWGPVRPGRSTPSCSARRDSVSPVRTVSLPPSRTPGLGGAQHRLARVHNRAVPAAIDSPTRSLAGADQTPFHTSGRAPGVALPRSCCDGLTALCGWC